MSAEGFEVLRQHMLAENLEDLHARIHRGAYRALPSRRVYIAKPDGRQRPLAIAALEDKIVQRATVAALDALVVGIEGMKVSWILDADIRSFFG
jgi:RNA-directed DNA polymerase